MNSKQYNDDDNNDEEDVLSLSDFPVIQNESNKENKELPLQPQLEFDFHSPPLKQSEMRAADEIFFRGQIKPIECLDSDYPRSESISSGSSSSSAAAPRNVFHSYPSPSPRILSRNERRVFMRDNCVKKSWSWSIFRLGLIAAPPPELGFRDLKTRCSGKSGGGGGEKKLKAKAWDPAGGCGNCAVDVAFMRRSASDGERRRRGGEESLAAAMSVNKSASSRTFEWLRQLSIHGAAVDER